MGMDRRTFLKLGGALALGSLITPGSQLLLASQENKTGNESKTRWAMVVDLDKCSGCNKECEEICRDENNVPHYGNERYDAYWLRVADVKQHLPGVETRERHIPLMCQHCDNPPCVHVCPTKASFVRDDGITLIDEHRCIGCRYCVIACPYRARSLIFRKSDKWTNEEVPKMMIGVVTKCSFCAHRVDKGQDPACVEKCPYNGLIFGNMNDPNSEVAKIIATKNTKILRPEKHLGPKVFYKGL
ncbi:MAG: 4Fe-4S dicluster domain-containing protein [Actinobacteria bacterium]|nr:4Fe-4S dicluster domain-containing protein [Actinomycetota bacterium]